MKYLPECDLYRVLLSPPSRGAWIEISMSPGYSGIALPSPPSRGAWIEMCEVS